MNMLILCSSMFVLSMPGRCKECEKCVDNPPRNVGDCDSLGK